jgi:hypothetical protein
MSAGEFKYPKGTRVVTCNNGTPGTIRKTKVTKKNERICTIHFDCDRPGKTWDMDEASLMLE